MVVAPTCILNSHAFRNLEPYWGFPGGDGSLVFLGPSLGSFLGLALWRSPGHVWVILERVGTLLGRWQAAS
eukprot:9449051-Pyramimonas_sp.AAC.1